jgi:hypothetical protein
MPDGHNGYAGVILVIESMIPKKWKPVFGKDHAQTQRDKT